MRSARDCAPPHWAMLSLADVSLGSGIELGSSFRSVISSKERSPLHQAKWSLEEVAPLKKASRGRSCLVRSYNNSPVRDSSFSKTYGMLTVIQHQPDRCLTGMPRFTQAEGVQGVVPRLLVLVGYDMRLQEIFVRKEVVRERVRR